MKQITVPFKKSTVGVPLVEFSCEGKDKLCAIVDTGSESTIFDTGFLKDNDLLKDDSRKMSLVGLNGEGEELTIYQVNAFLSFDEEGKKLPVEGISANLDTINGHIKMKHKEKTVVSVILGSDFLKKYKAKINYKAKELTLFYDLPGE